MGLADGWPGWPWSAAAGELANLVTAAGALLGSARARRESRGANTRVEFPASDPAWRCRLVHGRPRYERPPPVGVVHVAVSRALAEDVLPLGDDRGLVPENAVARLLIVPAKPVSRGQRCAAKAFALMDDALVVTWHAVTARRSSRATRGPGRRRAPS